MELNVIDLERSKLFQDVLFKQFRIEAGRCWLNVGQTVAAETPVGPHQETGKPIAAGCCGRIEAISFNGRESELVLVVTASPQPKKVG